ncbi:MULTISPECIES: plasmid mobilization protein [Intestinimonas]|uniref:plasmid mobilization protein n=1 Tax=Intestinimonas TaxID=1392389 RepID=UPI0018A03539
MSLIRKHTVSILLRLDEAQHRHLQKQVAASGLSTTQFLRDLIEGVEVKARLPNELPELLRQISAVGNNINQIARTVNTRKYATKEELAMIETLLAKIWDKVKDC